MAGRAFVNARVYSMHENGTPVWTGAHKPWQHEAEALLFQDGKIVAVGSNQEIRAKARSAEIESEDLDGRVVLPGFVDAHTHFLHIGVKRTRPDLREAISLDDALQRTATWLAAHPSKTPVIAEGWDESDWPGRARPNRGQLDELVKNAGQPERPLVLRRICGHVAVANSRALPLIRARWPSDDVVDVETGVILEAPSLYLNEVLPESDASLDAAIAEASRVCHSLGITAVGDYSQAPYRRALQRAANGSLTVRVASSIYVQQLEQEIARGFRTGQKDARGGQWLHDGGLKVFLDGSLGARTAALRTQYRDAPAGLDASCGGETRSRHGCVGHPHPNGTLNWGDIDVDRWFSLAHNAGIQIHAHAIGDAAIDQGLDGFEKLAKPLDSGSLTSKPAQPSQSLSQSTHDSGPTNRLRSRFEHFEIVHDDQVARAARLGIVASSQPNFVGTWSSKGGMYEDRLGPGFSVNNRFQTFKRAGIPISFGSDGMPPGPLLGIEAAVNHPDPTQRMEPLEAIWHYTFAAAWGLHWDKEIGSLAPGKRADFVVVRGTNTVSPDLESPETWQIHETITGGQTRFKA